MTAQARILVADDDPAMCLLLRETLQEAGYEVLIAHDGDQLVRMAQDHPPDLLLVDLMMPLMDGFEAIRQLRNDTRTSHLPMIILTARSASSEVVTGFDSGADDYIVKPYDIDVLLARIRSHLRRAAKLPVRNPLTGLPGNVLLQAELERQISQGTPFALIYVDLDNFKAFNDAYGFARGDRAIHMLAGVLAEVAPREDFLGHIGGDDFAIIHYGGHPEELAQRIIATFDGRVRELYDPADLQRGYLRGVDRHGVPRQFGLLSLSMSVVSSEGQRFTSVDEISKVAAEVKSAAKSIAGSSYVFDRRLSTQPPAEERRGQRRPAALLIYPDEGLRASIATSLRLQGYRPLIATDVLKAQDQLARTPDPVLMIANGADPAVWHLWRQLPAPTPLIAIVADEQATAAARANGAVAALIATDNLVDFTDQLLLHLPRAAFSELAEQPDTPDTIIRALQARARDLEREANEDSLTLLANRRQIDRRLSELGAQAARSGRTLAVLMASVDQFKELTDRFGLSVGNEVLRGVAGALRGICRPSDVAARYDGAEFLVLLPETSLADATVIAERIREAVEQLAWSTIHPQLQVTVSIGVAAASGPGAEQCIDQADRRLAAASRAGHNRVVAAEWEPEHGL
ncbi:MAG: diguanylate cyclase [Chloroflexi bacterium]|nr:diguanylate cyclase [Chloroflexota bacterium]